MRAACHTCQATIYFAELYDKTNILFIGLIKSVLCISFTIYQSVSDSTCKEIITMPRLKCNHPNMDCTSLTRLILNASCGSTCLNRVYRHPSQLFVPDVPATVSPQLQPKLVENINSTSLLGIQDNNSISGSTFKNSSE